MWLRKIFIWVFLSIVITGIYLTIYATVQHDIRAGANDPQIQLSEDMASELSTGQNLTYINSQPKVDISKSLALFIITYDSNGRAISSSAILDGKTPTLPNGVFDFVKTGVDKPSILRPKSFFYKFSQTQGENRFTWEPKEGVRIATVLTYYKGEKKSGYVLVGRSLREVEKREEDLEKQVALAWLTTLSVIFIGIILFPVKKIK